MKSCFHLCKMALIIALLLLYCASSNAQEKTGIFSGQQDIGAVKKPGSGTYDANDQSYALSGSGSNIWFDHDEFHYLYKKLKGNFILRAHLTFVGKGAEAHRKIGWMVRASLDSDAAHVSATEHGSGLTSLQYRRSKGDSMQEIQFDLSKANVIQLERRDGKYIMSAASFGDTLVSKEIDDINLGDEVYAGLFICSHNNNVSEKAVFNNVRIVIPAKENFSPYRDYIGSNLEVMDVKSGRRKILYQYKKSLQAPNWTNDGKYLIYNQEGLLYRFDLRTLQSTQINTGSATNCNNDHVISFDDKMLVISNSSPEADNQSLVYTLPLGGGSPKKITPVGPSYAHGWSPDGKYLVFTGQRNNDFDIYRVPAEGGKEIQLTITKGLDDGPEYSPDGKYIYFNSVRSGTMQIWRMKADGSDKEQLTNDNYNNWFPHISPDGKWIVFISFPLTVPPGDHPFYKHVYLRLMPVGGGPTKVIAYLYGGQGTINVPSWSPDSKKIAFVSNTDMSGE